MNLIILTEQDRTEKKQYLLNDDRFTHIKQILKSDKNDILQIGILNGPMGIAKILEISDEFVLLEILETNESVHPSPFIDIICALPRPQTLKKVLSTCTTMGVENLTLIRSEKVDKSYFQSPLLEPDNINKYLIEGLSQGKRTRLTNVSVHSRFKPFWDNISHISEPSTLCLLAHPENSIRMKDFEINKYSRVIFAIGPEGGWNDYEINLMKNVGFKPFSLSKSILRVENAVTASLAQLDLLTDGV